MSKTGATFYGDLGSPVANYRNMSGGTIYATGAITGSTLYGNLVSNIVSYGNMSGGTIYATGAITGSNGVYTNNLYDFTGKTLIATTPSTTGATFYGDLGANVVNFNTLVGKNITTENFTGVNVNTTNLTVYNDTNGTSGLFCINTTCIAESDLQNIILSAKTVDNSNNSWLFNNLAYTTLSGTGVCNTGYYGQVTYTSTGMSGCNMCTPGYYNTGINKLVCTACPSGTYNVNSGSISSTVCITCPSGSYCPTGTGSLTSCPPGYYCPTGTRYSTQYQCPAGYYCSGGVNVLPSGSTNRCPSGYYCPTGSTGPNTYQCPSGYYCPTGSTDPTTYQCPSGYYCPTGSTDPTTYQCPSGYYCPTGSTGPTTYLCPSGYYCPTGSTGPTTYQCKPGYYCIGGNMSGSETFCSIGTYNPSFSSSDSSSCITCNASMSEISNMTIKQALVLTNPPSDKTDTRINNGNGASYMYYVFNDCYTNNTCNGKLSTIDPASPIADLIISSSPGSWLHNYYEWNPNGTNGNWVIKLRPNYWVSLDPSVNNTYKTTPYYYSKNNASVSATSLNVIDNTIMYKNYNVFIPNTSNTTANVLSFNGNSYVKVVNLPNSISREFTVAFWFKFDSNLTSDTSIYTIASFGNSTASGWLICLQAKKIYFVSDATQYLISDTISSNVWTNVCINYKLISEGNTGWNIPSQTSLYCFINGVQTVNNLNINTVYYQTYDEQSTLIIGVNKMLNNPLPNGSYLTDFRFYTTAYTYSQIYPYSVTLQNVYNAVLNKICLNNAQGDYNTVASKIANALLITQTNYYNYAFSDCLYRNTCNTVTNLDTDYQTSASLGIVNTRGDGSTILSVGKNTYNFTNNKWQQSM